ncbi:MAG: SEC-C domain-containing protein [Taibaiella sp.]|nr:SEC-C domain-containing protein [Taibaiella sp.]
MLQVFDGADRLEALDLSANQITGRCLKYFSHSKNELKLLGLAETNIVNDEMLQIFDGASNLIHLILCNNQIKGDCLKYFLNSKTSLNELILHNNKIKEDVLILLSKFENLKDLTIDANIAPENHHIYEELRRRGTNIEFNYRDDIPAQPNFENQQSRDVGNDYYTESTQSQEEYYYTEPTFQQQQEESPVPPTPKSNTTSRAEAKIGRNDPCPCGSSKLYKQCHGKPHITENDPCSCGSGRPYKDCLKKGLHG